jgi:hypothetical protein
MGVFDLNNVVDFLGGFGQKRSEIATANQAAKEYKLQTVQTLFTFAEGKRASAEASRLLAGDNKLSENERDRHALDAERYSQEGESIYAGASELFGMIDEKPKTGKKENPAMQFLKFVNPFTRRGNQPGEFEEELSTLLAGLGGKGGGGAGGESPGFTAGGIGGAPPTGQGAGDPGQTATAAALGAAIPGTGPTPRLPAATGQVSPAAAILAQQQPGAATGEAAGVSTVRERRLALEAGEAPSATGITPTPARGPLLEQRVISARELYPHITGTRSAFKDMNLVDFNQNINREGQEALANLNAYIQSTEVRETFTDAMNDPNFTKHYRPAARAFQDTEGYTIFQKNIADIFPEMRDSPPEAGSALMADVARQLRLEQGGGKFADASTWTDKTIAAIDTLDVWMTMQADLGPIFVVMKRYLDTTRKDPETWTDADRFNVSQFKDFYDRGMFGPGTGPGRAGAPRAFQFPKGIDPDTGQSVYFVVDPLNPQAGGTPLRDRNGRTITTDGPLQLDEIMFTAEYTYNPDTREMERKSWRVEMKKVIAALSRPGTRRQIEQWLYTEIFDTTSRRATELYLKNNPTVGLAPGEDVTGTTPNLGNDGRPQLGVGAGGLEAFRARAREREEGGGGATAAPYVPPPSPY